MKISLEGKVALITGASRGIGLAAAHRLVSAGASVMLTSRKQSNLDEARATFRDDHDRVATTTGHVGRSEDAERVVASTIQTFGRLDILVNNAATNPYFGPLVDIDDVRMQKTYEINQASVLYHVRSAWHQWMKEHGGVIVNVASIGGLGPEPGIGWYNVTKAAVIHTTKQLAYELAPSVRVNAIAPGLVRTELARGLWETRESEIVRHIPMKRLGEPDDIASIILTLASDASSWMTGQTLVVDGGTINQPTGGVG
ncbi:MAG: SDR family oxidoreductase [Acidobacteria bacterium]|nr:SDR family oxidoreductase [Acidobacteriota bacterium]